ncbi:MAG: hypothetical protein A2V84_04345 [Chloroflexi bacterium RBG_16_70_13]|nr:MAG: hypothetical protein A2V84_04345 [Chloroflexi bacterium RBG_16_70_13]
MTIVEFWPDYDGALLWDESGERVPLAELSLPPDIVARAARWIAEYDDSKLPWEPTRDEAWLAEGRLLFAELRRELFARGIELQPNEPFWPEPDESSPPGPAR